MDDATVTRRALAAYYRSGGLDRPDDTSGVAVVDGLRYVALRRVGRLVAAFRVRNDGQLKRLRRWPDALTGDPAAAAH